MKPVAHIAPVAALVLLAGAGAWLWFTLVFAVMAVADVALLWVHPYGRCRGLEHKMAAGSGDGPRGFCPKCHGDPVPRPGAAAVAALIGDKHGKRYWRK